MLADVDEAAALGFDQICIYHLVLAEGQGTPWAEDPAVRAALPSLEEACDNWLAVREALRERGYVQTTLTNFERAEVHATDRRFVYEEYSFTPERYDAIGFGPLSSSTFTNLGQRRAVKLARGKSLEGAFWGAHDLYFPYGEEDLRLLFTTRSLALLRIPRPTYRDLFGVDLVEHFGAQIEAIEAAGLARLDADAAPHAARDVLRGLRCGAFRLATRRGAAYGRRRPADARRPAGRDADTIPGSHGLSRREAFAHGSPSGTASTCDGRGFSPGLGRPCSSKPRRFALAR
ncbi:hypothetical protein [Polyangium jinanense]|uniref:Uncharacterized protein n=1 Tax=Polyangium jinanense TaxID=2829994 RepID=A0A9X4AX18_9BACT|nr:hypothetical protein [Polyangium jinanense]MDC3960991.1 hypothetical protein [Polyangium jinanense]MDC3987411.1 hypothetical protein [Polyangium jinanense]